MRLCESVRGAAQETASSLHMSNWRNAALRRTKSGEECSIFRRWFLSMEIWRNHKGAASAAFRRSDTIVPAFGTSGSADFRQTSCERDGGDRHFCQESASGNFAGLSLGSRDAPTCIPLLGNRGRIRRTWRSIIRAIWQRWSIESAPHGSAPIKPTMRILVAHTDIGETAAVASAHASMSLTGQGETANGFALENWARKSRWGRDRSARALFSPEVRAHASILLREGFRSNSCPSSTSR